MDGACVSTTGVALIAQSTQDHVVSIASIVHQIQLAMCAGTMHPRLIQIRQTAPVTLTGQANDVMSGTATATSFVTDVTVLIQSIASTVERTLYVIWMASAPARQDTHLSPTQAVQPTIHQPAAGILVQLVPDQTRASVSLVLKTQLDLVTKWDTVSVLKGTPENTAHSTLGSVTHDVLVVLVLRMLTVAFVFRMRRKLT
jgi:hypothetical protein